MVGRLTVALTVLAVGLTILLSLEIGTQLVGPALAIVGTVLALVLYGIAIWIFFRTWD